MPAAKKENEWWMYSRYCLLQSLHASISTKRANLSYRRCCHSSQGGSYSCNDSRDPHTCRRRTGYCCTHLCRLLKRKREQCATSEHNHIHACTLKKCKTLKSKTNDKPSTWCWMHDFVRYILYSILKWGRGGRVVFERSFLDYTSEMLTAAVDSIVASSA